MNRIYTTLLLLLISLTGFNAQAQLNQKIQNQPYADQKLYHLGFFVSLHVQDMILTNTGYTGSTGEAWFADIPTYKPGFSVGIIGDRYLNEYFNLRLSPTLHFGEKEFVFREQATGEEYRASLRGNYLSMPLHLKFNAGRINNFRPYILAGGYASMNISNDKDEALRFKKMDYGLEFGIGCNIYLPLFKLCPELRFSFGLADLIDKDRSDMTDWDMTKYRDAVSAGKTRMISLIFNFE
jgi:hypothetical protein